MIAALHYGMNDGPRGHVWGRGRGGLLFEFIHHLNLLFFVFLYWGRSALQTVVISTISCLSMIGCVCECVYTRVHVPALVFSLYAKSPKPS